MHGTFRPNNSFFSQRMIDPFDGFVNLRCVHEADHPVPPAFSSPNNPVGSGMRSRNTTLVAPSRRKSRQAGNPVAHVQQVLVGFLEGGGVDRVGGMRRKLFD